MVCASSGCFTQQHTTRTRQMKSHQQLGEDMDLFHQDPHAPGMVFWHPRGLQLFRSIAHHMRNVYDSSGFEEVQSPQLMKQSLWAVSGHLDYFSENMFLIDGRDHESSYAIKPMSCPAHILLFKRSVQTVKSLPVRLFEFGNVHRNEPSGSLNGLFRLRQFTQDDAHVFCAWKDINNEVAQFISRVKSVYASYGFYNFSFKLSTRPEKAFGDQKRWLEAEHALAGAMQKADIEFEVQVGEGAFYGPKIEVALQDSSKRNWQCGTIQLDFNLPERFDLNYRDANQQPARPVILHQAMYGSLERWIGILLEAHQGLPTWVHPQPVVIVPVKEAAAVFAKRLQTALGKAGVRSSLDGSSVTLARKLKRAHQARAVFVCILGEREISEAQVMVRRQSDGTQISIPMADISHWMRNALSRED